MSSTDTRPGPYQTSTPVAYIAHESEEMVHVRRAELRYWAKEVIETIKNPLEGASVWAATCAGISVSAALSGLGLLATEDATHQVPSGVYLVMLAAFLGFGGIALFSWWIDGKQREVRGGRAGSLAAQIIAADTRSPRNPAIAAHASLDVWLDERSAEIRGLKAQLEDQLAASAFDHGRVSLIEQMFWSLNEDVLKRLHLAAPEWVDYYRQNPDWYVEGLTRIRPEEFREILTMMDFTLDQIAHVIEHLDD